MEQKLDHAFRANGRMVCIAIRNIGDSSTPTMKRLNLVLDYVYAESCVESNVGIVYLTSIYESGTTEVTARIP